MNVDAILVLDFGGQYAHLIARRIRECNVYSEVVPGGISSKEFQDIRKKFPLKGIVFSGGPSSVFKKSSPKIDKELLDHSIPILGLCYGHQLLAFIYGGKVQTGMKHEYGVAKVRIDNASGILKGLKEIEKVWMSHADVVTKIPKDYEILARTENCPVAAFMHKIKPIFGLQWHPEVTHTEKGMLIISNFVFDICKCEPEWTMENYINKAINEVKETVGESRAIIALSGGVDSSAATILSSKAIGNNLTAVFIDHGLLREN